MTVNVDCSQCFSDSGEDARRTTDDAATVQEDGRMSARRTFFTAAAAVGVVAITTAVLSGIGTTASQRGLAAGAASAASVSAPPTATTVPSGWLAPGHTGIDELPAGVNRSAAAHAAEAGSPFAYVESTEGVPCHLMLRMPDGSSYFVPGRNTITENQGVPLGGMVPASLCEAGGA